MPTIYPNLIPTVQPGSIFSEFVNNQSYSIRWITKNDPVFFEVANRPIADSAVRQLILAKAVDQINLRLGHQAYYPFIVQPSITSGTSSVELPISWIWDMNVSIPEKWEDLRLAKIKRMSGENSSGTDNAYSGILRLFFTAMSSAETYLFYVDYDIASPLSYQQSDIVVVSDEETPAIISAEYNTIAGQVMFRTLDIDEAETRTFFDAIPPSDTTDIDNDGFYDNPTSYETTNDDAGVVGASPISHGSGLLTDSAWNRIPDLGASVDAWIEAFNYPFRVTANRESYTIVNFEPITIPSGLFTEFNITAPAGDDKNSNPTGYPVWVSRIKIGDITTSDPNYLTFYFATHNILDSNSSLTPIEFGYLILNQNDSSGTTVPIQSTSNLYGMTGANEDPFNQQFGRGHVVLSSKWGTSEVNDFFDKFPLIVGDDEAFFVQTNTMLSPFGVDRSPKYAPTKGQNQALYGSTSRFDDPAYPSSNNMFVTELDQGIGNKIDLHSQTNPLNGSPITANDDIDQYGYEGSLLAKKVTMIVNAAGTGHTYELDVLPRLRCLFNREFVHGDLWFDGTRWKRWDSISEAWIG